MTRLFLIRHGEPDAAWGGAEPDPGLSPLGRAQAEDAAAALAEQGSLAVLSSPMRRCLETAAPYAARRSLTPVVQPRISEVATPHGVGDRRAWLAQNFPWRTGVDQPTWSTLDSELRRWRAEVLGWAHGVDADCAAFTHFVAINVIVGAALGREETVVVRPDYASITELELQAGALRLVRAGHEMRTGEVR